MRRGDRTNDLLIRGGSVVTTGGVRTADVLIEGGTIAAVGPGVSSRGARVVDADGAVVLPGAIDAHVHPIHGETIETVAEAAAFGGVTTVLHHVYPDPDQSMATWLSRLRDEASSVSRVDFGFHARLRRDAPHHLDELGAVAALGVRSFKVFTSYGQPGVRFAPNELLDVMTRVRAIRGLLLVHAEDQEAIVRLERETGPPDHGPQAYLAARPPATEAVAVREVADAASSTDVGLYFVHLSTGEALDAITVARARGTRIFAETCPHYLWLDAQEVVDRFGARAKIAPPLRSVEERRVLWRAVLDGRVDVIASDHCGYEPGEKEETLIPFERAGFGAPGVETLLPLLFDAAMRGDLALDRLVELTAGAPARVFGLDRKGQIARGYDGDVVVVDPGSTTRIGPPYHGAAYYSLFEGRQIRGAITHVYLRGEELARSTYPSEPPRGRFVATYPDEGLT